MKRGAYLVNTARGKIADRDAVARALRDGPARRLRGRRLVPAAGAAGPSVADDAAQRDDAAHLRHEPSAQTRYAAGHARDPECWLDASRSAKDTLIAQGGRPRRAAARTGTALVRTRRAAPRKRGACQRRAAERSAAGLPRCWHSEILWLSVPADCWCAPLQPRPRAARGPQSPPPSSSATCSRSTAPRRSAESRPAGAARRRSRLLRRTRGASSRARRHGGEFVGHVVMPAFGVLSRTRTTRCGLTGRRGRCCRGRRCFGLAACIGVRHGEVVAGVQGEHARHGRCGQRGRHVEQAAAPRDCAPIGDTRPLALIRDAVRSRASWSSVEEGGRGPSRRSGSDGGRSLRPPALARRLDAPLVGRARELELLSPRRP